MSSTLLKTLQLSQIQGLGLRTYWKLIDNFGSVEEVFNTPESTLKDILSPKVRQAIAKLEVKSSQTAASKVIEWCHENQVQLIDHSHRDYPPQLLEICMGPPLLYVKGDSSRLREAQLAIVGSRSASQAGLNNAKKLAAELASEGLIITSGLALGIDTEAHRGALAGGGCTVAVVGTGIDQVYPKRNVRLADEIIASGGAIVSEFALATPPLAQNFPRRNRIISGLSLGTLVVEAALKSGSLISAKFALEQNREVFAMPGSIHNPRSRGCHALIKQGAALVETCEDILLQLGFTGPATFRKESDKSLEEVSDREALILQHVDYDSTSLEELADKTQMEVGELLSILMSLELRGVIGRDAVGFVRINSNLPYRNESEQKV